LATTFVLSMTWTIQALVENRHLDPGWRVTAVVTGMVIFGRPVYTKLRTLAARDRRRAIGLDRDAVTSVPAVVEPAHVFGGYDVWAALHREAADAAERWLSAILGERPAFAVAAAIPETAAAARHNPESRTLDRLRVAAVRALHAPIPGPRPPRPAPAGSRPRTAAGRNTETRALEMLREAAVRELGLQRRETLPVRTKPLPTRRRSEPPTSGDMNAVMVSIAQPTDPYLHEISATPDSHTRAHTTSGVRKGE
jgi:hypothetical protein